MTKQYIWDIPREIKWIQDEKNAWLLFRATRWKDNPERNCIYCKSTTSQYKQAKEGNQAFYVCKKCGKRFSDLTDTPFNKTRLKMSQILLMTSLAADNIPTNRIYQLLGVAKTTAFRYCNEIKSFRLCIEIANNLKEMGITTEIIIKYLDPELSSKMRYRKHYMQEETKQEIATCFYCRRSLKKAVKISNNKEEFYKCPKCGMLTRTALQIKINAHRENMRDAYRGRVPDDFVCMHGVGGGCNLCIKN